MFNETYKDSLKTIRAYATIELSDRLQNLTNEPIKTQGSPLDRALAFNDFCKSLVDGTNLGQFLERTSGGVPLARLIFPPLLVSLKLSKGGLLGLSWRLLSMLDGYYEDAEFLTRSNWNEGNEGMAKQLASYSPKRVVTKSLSYMKRPRFLLTAPVSIEGGLF